jgi:hypothetical protein
VKPLYKENYLWYNNSTDKKTKEATMSKTWDDGAILYKETEEEVKMREEQEITAKNRSDIYGAHCSFHGKARGSFKPNTKISVPRVKKMKVNTSSKAWKDYMDKKISFQQMKLALGI